MELETVSPEALNAQYEELLKEHDETETHNWSQFEITETLILTQNPSVGLAPKHAEILVDLINHKSLNLKQAAVQGIARCATFTNNQVSHNLFGLINRSETESNVSKILNPFSASHVFYHLLMFLGSLYCKQYGLRIYAAEVKSRQHFRTISPPKIIAG